MTWSRLGAVTAPRLAAARLELHWAAQVLCAAADGWIDHAADDSHTSMTWDSSLRALVGARAPSELALALAVDSFELLALRGAATASRFALAGSTLGDALAWADREEATAASAAPRAIAARTYDMPAHAVSSGGTFTRDADALGELGAWYGAGMLALAGVGGIPLRVWPHHFDLGTIVYLDQPGERAPQIGVGLSPGDSYYAEPYFYLTPYPIRDGAAFAPLAAGGFWRREGWTGAVLTASALLAADASGRAARAASFLESALAASRAVI